MSIWTGKDGYDSIKEFQDRTRRELLDRTSEDFAKDTVLEQPILDFLQRHLGFGGWDVLEVGCGFGKWSIPIVGWGNSYVGLDPCGERLKYALEYMPDAAMFLVGGFEDIALMDPVDAVLFVTVIQHFTLAQARSAMAAAAAKLRLGGKLLLVESLIVGDWYGTLDEVAAECQRLYSLPSQPSHMIPKPKALLQEVVPGLRWETDGDFHVLTKER